jgi:hypothetical protein
MHPGTLLMNFIAGSCSRQSHHFKQFKQFEQ